MATPVTPSARPVRLREFPDSFIKHLITLLGSESGTEAKPDRAALAALRRGLGKTPGEVAEMFPHVIPYCGDASESRQDDYFLVAALFALLQSRTGPYPGKSRERNTIGGSFALLDQKTNAHLEQKSKSASIEKRFVALLNASREDLPTHLRYAVSLFKAREVPVDWSQLLWDLRRWDAPTREVQRRWAAGYWYTDHSDRPSENGENAATPTASTSGTSGTSGT